MFIDCLRTGRRGDVRSLHLESGATKAHVPCDLVRGELQDQPPLETDGEHLS